MIKEEVVFDTIEEAEAREALDWLDYVTANNDTVTKRWAIPRQRIDGKIAYPVCPNSDYTGMRVEPYDVRNYSNDEG